MLRDGWAPTPDEADEVWAASGDPSEVVRRIARAWRLPDPELIVGHLTGIAPIAAQPDAVAVSACGPN